jgi:hypothetical protein
MELKQVIEKSAESLIGLKEKIAETIEQISEGGADGKKPVSDEKMAELRERLKKMKVESELAAKKRASQKKKTLKQSKPALVKPKPAEPEPAEALAPLEQILIPPANNAPKPAIDEVPEDFSSSVMDEPESETASGNDASVDEDAAVVESVEGLPVIDSDDPSESDEVSDIDSVDVPETTTE